MEIAVIVLLLVCFVLMAIIWKTVERVRDFRLDNEGLKERCREYARQLTIEALHGQASKLSIKLATARAPVEAQIERYKHQNNEMRVCMSRIHRYLTELVNECGKKDGVGDYPKELVNKSMSIWTACNDWLSANKIEPYLGPVPGYDGQTQEQRAQVDPKELASAT